MLYSRIVIIHSIYQNGVNFEIAREYGKNSLPLFMFLTYDPLALQLMGIESDVGTSIIEIILSDSQNAQTSYNMSITVEPIPQASGLMSALLDKLLNKGSPEFVQLIPDELVINKGQTYIYNLPQIYDPDYDLYDCYVELGTAKPFATVTGLSIKFKPSSSHISTSPYLIKITLRDFNVHIQKKSLYTLKVIVNGTKGSETKSNNYYLIDDKDSQSDSGNSTRSMKTTKVSLRLIEVTQNHRAKIKLIAKNSEKFMSKINNDSFSINITTRETNFKVNYTIESLEPPTILLKLDFIDPYTLSKMQDYDMLAIETTQQITVRSSNVEEKLASGLIISNFIPQQLTDQEWQEIQGIQSAGEYSTYALLSSNFILNIFLSGILAYLFGLLNDISQVTMLALININIPGKAQIFNKILMDFIYMDLLQTNIWIDYLIDTEDPEDIALCPSFSLAGFNSKSTIKNLGSSFVFLSILVGILVLILLLKILTFFLPLKILESIHRNISQNILWNVPIRFLIQQYQSTFISSLLGINLTFNSFHLSYEDYLTITQTFPNKLNAYLTITLCITGSILPIIILGIIKSFRRGRNLKSPQFRTKYGTILEGIRTFKKKKLTITQSIALYWNAITIARWGISIAIFVFLKDLASLQVILLLSISLLFTLLIAFIKPFSIDDTILQGGFFVINENYFKLLNEIFVTYYLIVLLMLTDITTDIELRAIFGMIELGIVVTCVLTNILKGGLATTKQFSRGY